MILMEKTIIMKVAKKIGGTVTTLALIASLLTGCDSTEGTLGGAALGTAAGAGIGYAIDGGAGGTILGGVIGGLAGGVIGHHMGEKDKKEETQAPIKKENGEEKNDLQNM